MSVARQSAIGFVLLVLAFAGWAAFYPGARPVLSSWGLDWLPLPADLASAASDPGAQGGAAPGMNATPQQGVVAAAVTQATINDRLSAIGTGRAKQSVAVTPYVAGRMIELLVTSGATVAADEVIARLDAETETIAVDRARFALEDALARAERVRSLRASNAATAVQVNEAALAVENARLALRDAELALSRRTITAPISGVVGILPVAAGNYVTTSTEVARIDDRSAILVDFWVPERYAGLVTVGMELTAASVARPGEVYSGEVSALDNRIDADSRTLQVQALIRNPNDRLRAGMSFQVAMRFAGDTFPAVDPLAIQWGADGAYVWVVRDDIAVRTPVRVIQRNTDTVLVDADIDDDDIVVIEGLHAVREGARVRIAQIEGRARPSPEAAAPATGSGS